MITDNYKKMCEMATEIQKGWKPEINDWCTDPDGDYSTLYSIGDAMRKNPTRWNIWLPTLEQLFEMANWETVSRDDIIGGLNELASDILKTDDPIPWNEFWLMIVMKEKYHKTWNGKKWEVINEY